MSFTFLTCAGRPETNVYAALRVEGAVDRLLPAQASSRRTALELRARGAALLASRFRYTPFVDTLLSLDVPSVGGLLTVRRLRAP